MAKKHSTRQWWWNHFAEHPGYTNKQDTSMVSGKAKVIYKVIYKQHITQEQRLDQEQVSTGQRESPRDVSAIVGTLWATAQNDTHRIWLVSWPSTLLCHLRDCELPPTMSAPKPSRSTMIYICLTKIIASTCCSHLVFLRNLNP
ncbi:hypothetical protein PAXRUDRAFT_156469 [Paxillus rubicundulus Ve08.2h10]|uniref:Uncharacterized protein n=1 Tax=Paxillus rubicundulus Ve08.2h10 TaxID=930991 RepID=A0A0D0CET3_9AGAM|nr:hypothetical protein PAXRUDRAFT_156469 [Paxillus rubicundulus Ve08.2h10]